MMKENIWLLMGLTLIIATACTSKGGGRTDVESSEVSGNVFFGDPFIMLYKNTYYAYGTSAENGILVYTSDDLETWRIPEQNLALNKNDVWGDRWFWAPEVYYINDIFYIFYSANEHINVATGKSPLGPFVQQIKKPMLEDEQSIDNSLFIDDDGTPYLYFDRFNDGLSIWVAELEEDLMTMKKETLKKCIQVSQEWERVWPTVNEGAFVIKHNGRYYMTYSANSYESQFYGIGVATADSPTGPWTKYERNPIYQNVGKLVGIGHSAIFTDKDGDMRIVFHSHNSEASIHPRIMHISRVYFEDRNGENILRIDSNYMTPQLLIK
jgi:beta-xylosidase